MTKLSLLAALCIAGLFLAACGGNNDAPPPSSIVIPPVDGGDDDDDDDDGDGDGDHDNDDGSEDDNNDDGSADNSDPSEPPVYWAHAETTLFLLPNRIEQLRRQLEEDDSAFLAMRSWLNTYLGRTPYNSGEYAKAYALGYHLTGDEDYLEQGKRLLWQGYFSDPDVGWRSFTNRNGFRTGGNRIAISYAWLRFAFNQEERSVAEQHIATWTEHWLDYTNHQNDFHGYRFTDTDKTAAIAENLTLFGYILQQNESYQELAELSLSVADTMLQRFVVDYYMHDIMAGGVWAEGSDYSPRTQLHWMRVFLINRDLRDLPFPSEYAEHAAAALIQHTLPGSTGVYQFGSVEQGRDYRPVFHDGRYQFALYLTELLQGSEVRPQLQSWLENQLETAGHLQVSLHPGIERVLFYQQPSKPAAPTSLSKLHFAPGVGLISARSSWEADATSLYFITRRSRVDHEHSDALNIDVAHRGVWITKQVTGYSAAGARSDAHNTLLIENATLEGSANPTGRALGNGFYRTIFQDGSITLISAEATDIYNMSGYFATTYAELVTRQVALIGEQTLAIFDNVRTLPNQIRDLQQYKPELGLQRGDEYIRQVTVNQLFQGEPVEHEFAVQGFRIQTNEMIGYYQVAWPEQANIRKVDGREFWANETQHSVPDNQRKWRLKISPAQPQVHTEVLTYFEFEGATGKAPLIYNNVESNDQLELNTGFQPQEKFIMNIENGTLNSDHWFGAGFIRESTLVLFSRFPDQPKESFLQLSIPENVAIQSLYILGWQPEARVHVDVAQQGRLIELTPTNNSGNNTHQATEDGLVVIKL
ncbi:hypothetical protein QWY20_03030 [Alkalimonas sp. MEB108]|uniref:Heparinase II/III family protein n=1 Tax=Alkalimonas cellulosilytica TaxID=3058395 RepID=A0ABU7J1N7_9GAMM|nr:hypothetical protein [Alkalimonas sp. MEB108]MEE2000415.1 hypothetical protein [Alkalimonas sp. MEB108]